MKFPRMCILLLTSLYGIGASYGQQGETDTQPAETSMPPLQDATIMPAPFPIDVMGDLGGLKIGVEAGYTGADAYAKLVNDDQVRASCTLHFRAGPDGRRRRQQLDAGKEALVVAGLRRRIVRLRIYVTCTAAAPDG